MDSIKNIIPQVVEKMAQQRADSQIALERIWGRLFEKSELQYVKLVGIRDGKLHACVDSPARLYHLRLRKAKILEEIRKEIPEIQDILFKVNG